MAILKRSRQISEKYGRYAEWFAIFLLTLKGYRILKRRLKTPVGEIDILCQKANSLVAVEVKFRTFLFSDPIPSWQQERITRALLYYLSHHPSPHSWATIRFDMILFRRYLWQPFHLVNAWSSHKFQHAIF